LLLKNSCYLPAFFQLRTENILQLCTEYHTNIGNYTHLLTFY